ncbi:phage terminase small subunit [Vibrio nigripulchritudo]|uniref:hypothetical protein n=1 Tax=Vibrio nigripulchritudo TaxID=28173 RepID=UPI00190C91CD|nr:hypothetical protein [Vibrio nigripulchritudo]BCL70527.1 phage terminase small subunit [Vibrio nigripulchritudo]BDU31880.1 phage terminase small subunit [Vibrio nigripulchritudo]
MPTCKRTQRRDNRFFDALEAGFGVGESARRAGYSRRSTYDYRDQDADFAKRWEEAIESHVEALEIEADRRASVGVEEPVFYKGKECGRVRKFSDNLLMFRLKALAPEKYRERRELTGKDGGPIETAVSFTCMVLEAIDGQTRSK